MAQQQLPPMNPPLGPQPTDSGLYWPGQVTLHLREKMLSLSGDTFTVTTADTQTPVVKCQGKAMSLHARKTFLTPNDQELFTIKTEMFSLSKSFRAESPLGYDFSVEGHFSLGSSKSSVHFTNASDGRTVELDLKGDWLDRSADITLGGQPVARVERQFMNAREMLGGQQTYFVTVAPNVDLSLIAGVCVCLDEREND
ncbi:hypothetical protein MBLNU230_g5966t1 [Neophaeotheca triangularis]